MRWNRLAHDLDELSDGADAMESKLYSYAITGGCIVALHNKHHLEPRFRVVDGNKMGKVPIPSPARLVQV